MQKLLLLSVVLSLVVIPGVVAKRVKHRELGLKRTIQVLIAINVTYVFFLVFIYGRF